MQTWQVLVTVFTFGGLGSMIRVLVIHLLSNTEKLFPTAILLVNLLAAFLGGLILCLTLPNTISTALLVGLVGGIGTLSSINGNLLDFIFDGKWRRLVLYLILTSILGIFAARAGLLTGNYIHDTFIAYTQEQQADRIKALGITPSHYSDDQILFTSNTTAKEA